MFSIRVKSQIYKIIPEHSLFIKATKKIYGGLLFLKSLLFKENPRASSRRVARFIAEQMKESKVFLNVDFAGNELFFLKSIENMLSSADAPNIIYKADGGHTKRFGYHPVEIMWFLQDLGYSFSVLDKAGKVISRKPREYEGDIIAVKPKS